MGSKTLYSRVQYQSQNMRLILGRAFSAIHTVIVPIMIVLSNSLPLGKVHECANKEHIICQTYILFN
jgi:hypothetical protein